MKRRLFVLVAAAFIFGGWTCDGERFALLCAKYTRGSDWANKVIKERLDVAAVIAPPAWSATYLATRNVFIGADSIVRGACAASDLTKVKPDVVKASEAIQSLIVLHEQIAGESTVTGPVMRAGETPLIDMTLAPPPGLYSEMAEVISAARER